MHLFLNKSKIVRTAANSSSTLRLFLVATLSKRKLRNIKRNRSVLITSQKISMSVSLIVHNSSMLTWDTADQKQQVARLHLRSHKSLLLALIELFGIFHDFIQNFYLCMSQSSQSFGSWWRGSRNLVCFWLVVHWISVLRFIIEEDECLHVFFYVCTR